MKAKLIILENPVIVTDEEINFGDTYYLPKENKVATCEKPIRLNSVTPEWTQKIISHNKPIDYNGIDFGIVDVEWLALQRFPFGINWGDEANIANTDRILGFKEGFKASQQLNENKFTSEDMMKAMEYGAQFRKSTFILHIQREDEFKKMSAALSLPKTFEVEIEETDTNIKIIKKL